MRHRRTDPACAEHTPPHTARQRRRFDRNRDRRCLVCYPALATSLDCLDGVHLACETCGCNCHRLGDPATRAARIAGTPQDPHLYDGGGDC